MAEWLNVLQQIPESAWTAIVAIITATFTLFGTLGGVLISNRHTSRQRDREMELKREVFMPAMDAVMGLQAALIEIAKPDPGRACEVEYG